MNKIIVNNADLSPETAVNPHCGKTSHDFDLVIFKSGIGLDFANKYCGRENPKEWLEKWLKAPLESIGGVSPEKAILSGNIKLVRLRAKQNIRGAKRKVQL